MKLFTTTTDGRRLDGYTISSPCEPYGSGELKNEGARVFIKLYSNFSDAQGQKTLELVVVSGRNLNSFKLSCMSLIPARMRMIESKMKKLECSQDFSHYKSIRDVMDVLVTCKYEEDPIKNKGARVLTTLYSNFSEVQGQITLELVVVSDRNLNSFKLSCMSSLPARMRMIESKMKKLECSQDFSHYKSMGIFPDAQGQLTPKSLVRSCRILNLSEML